MTIILLIVVWLSNGQVNSESITAHSIAECNNHAPLIVADILVHNKKIVREKHICLEI